MNLVKLETVAPTQSQFKFWTFMQNNSGGSFDSNDDVCETVVIETPDLKSAIEKAREVGIYFNGVSEGIDCPCCGDRWHEPWIDEGSFFPEEYGQDIREMYDFYDNYEYAMGLQPADRKQIRGRVIVHLYNGVRLYGVRKSNLPLVV